METHEPYSPPPRILRRLFDGKVPPKGVNLWFFCGRKKPLTHAKLELVRRVYDAAVLQLDEGVRNLSVMTNNSTPRRATAHALQ